MLIPVIWRVLNGHRPQIISEIPSRLLLCLLFFFFLLSMFLRKSYMNKAWTQRKHIRSQTQNIPGKQLPSSTVDTEACILYQGSQPVTQCLLGLLRPRGHPVPRTGSVCTVGSRWPRVLHPGTSETSNAFTVCIESYLLMELHLTHSTTNMSTQSENFPSVFMFCFFLNQILPNSSLPHAHGPQSVTCRIHTLVSTS